MNIKPEDLMRALECCTFNPNCEECPFGGEDCIQLDQLALALLRDYRNQISILKALLERCETQFAEKDAEIERLKGLLVKATNDAEQARFQCKNICEPNYKNLLETARADVINEFAERLKAACDAPHWCVWLSDIEEIAKEMKEKNI